ncbi:MAG: ferrochelatase [Alphaproteobacteria bacterium]|nr:ferrochelatase [Alphaproteobacteria bacterium]MCY4231539.1 ferrochelatase [Alphaproteobacteria bacterium]MCY4317928.1 ferrochelatase [Alphaproteobacteria bacterium]
MSRLAVILFNLGGPDSPEAVKPFLRNLFFDPAIIPAPAPVRFLLARYIAGKRTAPARAVYEQLGGSSPLLAQTEAQARALEAALTAQGQEARCFIAMRYWHPRAAAALAAVRLYEPDEIVALPLYPQYSTTTSGSSLAEWQKLAGADARLRVLCCHPLLEGLVEAWAGPLAEAVRCARAAAPVRVLFSAHGLPERVVAKGDPYAWQVARTAEALQAAAEARLDGLSGVDWRVTWQSRATPEKWLQPDTGVEVEAAAREGLALVLAPIAFISEHSETLVELDLEYRAVAERAGAAAWERVATPGTAPNYIEALAALVLDSQPQKRLCPASCSGCPVKAA